MRILLVDQRLTMIAEFPSFRRLTSMSQPFKTTLASASLTGNRTRRTRLRKQWWVRGPRVFPFFCTRWRVGEISVVVGFWKITWDYWVLSYSFIFYSTNWFLPAQTYEPWPPGPLGNPDRRRNGMGNKNITNSAHTSPRRDGEMVS